MLVFKKELKIQANYVGESTAFFTANEDSLVPQLPISHLLRAALIQSLYMQDRHSHRLLCFPTLTCRNPLGYAPMQAGRAWDSCCSKGLETVGHWYRLGHDFFLTLRADML